MAKFSPVFWMRAAPWMLITLPAALVVVGFLPNVEAASFHVHIQGFAFSPQASTINVGDTITWDNHDGVFHTTTDNNCPRAGGPGPCEWDSLNMASGASFTHTFNTGGFFNYRCTIHGFTGTVNVVDPNAQPDLTVSDLTFLTNLVPTSKQVRATVTNAGTGSAGPTVLRGEYEYQGARLVIGTVNVAGIAPGASQLVTLNWNTLTKLGDFTVHAIADSNGAVTESNEGNNDSAAVASVLLPPGTLQGIDLADPL